MPVFANELLQLQIAIMRSGHAPLGRETLRIVLDKSSTTECRDGDKYWGKVIDIDRARDIALDEFPGAALSNNGATVIPAINALLLEDEPE